MQKKNVLFILTLTLLVTQQIIAQYTLEDVNKKRYFVGSTLFVLGNFSKVNPPGFAQVNLGYRLSGKDVLSLELITWKHAWPLGINPFYNNAYGDPEEKFPGYIREYGAGLAYQRYLWKGLYAAVHLAPMWQTFKNQSGNKVDDGFILFNTYRVGYHIKLFKDKFFIEPSIGIAGRPYYSEMPDGFKQQDDKWPKWTPEPGLHFGYNF